MSTPHRCRARAACVVAAACLLAGCAGPAAAPAGPAASLATGEGFLERGRAALRAEGLRVDRASAGVVRSRPRAVPSGLEPWRDGPGGGGGAALAAAATVSELREVATLRSLPGGGVAVEVWLERRHRPDRRLVVRSGGRVFGDAEAIGGWRSVGAGSAPATPFGEGSGFAGPGVAEPVTLGRDVAEPAVAAVTPFSDPSSAAASAPADGGGRWDRWRRDGRAESSLHAAFAATGPAGR